MTPNAPNPNATLTYSAGGNSTVLGDGLALLEAAEHSGDWKAVVDWMAANPSRAGELANHLALARKFGAVIPQPAAVRTGTSVGGFELGEKLGGGGMGDVYRAFDPALKQHRAIKLLRAGGGFTPLEAARFREEAELVASLDHPNVVRVQAFGEAEVGPYLVMELMAGGSLAGWLKARANRPTDPKEAARIVRHVALGVQHAHERGLIHRDLKPGNVLMDAAGLPRVADFGLARRQDASAVTGEISGTIAYMAPEQARGEKVLTTAVDVYALGVVLFELLAGRGPYAGLDVPSALRRVADGTEPVPPVREFRPDVPADLAAVCAKCLEKRPGDRYRSAQELADDLQRFLDDRPVTAQPPGFWDWLRQLARIRPPDSYATPFWPVTGWFGLIMLLAGVAVYGLARADAQSVWVWVTNVAAGGTQFVVLWWYMLRRFRLVPRIDRDSFVLATGCVFLYFPLTAAYVPLSWSASARDGLGIYPALAAITGLAFFTLGSTNWSRFFAIGLGVMCMIPLLTRWPGEAPLLYGTAMAVALWYWTWATTHIPLPPIHRNDGK